MMGKAEHCRNCGKELVLGTDMNRGVWVHKADKSRFCDLGGVRFAVPSR